MGGTTVRNKKLLTPHEAEIDKLTQIMAVLVEKLGGEVIVSRQELEAFFDIPVVTRVISPDYIMFRNVYPDEADDTKGVDLPGEEIPPQT
jgi:hypothetical protein